MLSVLFQVVLKWVSGLILYMFVSPSFSGLVWVFNGLTYFDMGFHGF